jgi:hypothetical protein
MCLYYPGWPKLLSELHPTKNGSLDAAQVTRGYQRIFEDALVTTRPYLAAEFHPTKNAAPRLAKRLLPPVIE